MIKRRSPELLCPAGSLPLLKIAILYGADAVYLGGEAFSLRAKAQNFTRAEMEEGIAFAHAHGAKVYVTANIFAHESDLPEAAAYFRELAMIRPDGVLVADPGMFALARENCPELPLHISTQANTTNSASARFWHAMGASRIVTARELSLLELRRLREAALEIELEAFVHGAMCISYSGRCLLSNYLAGRDANRGLCTHPCRWKYAVMEETRPGEYFPIEENERGTFLFNSKDLCMVGHLPELYEAGIDSFKIEGRMKTALYVAACARTYRLAMNDYERDPDLYKERIPWYLSQIAACTTRTFTTGFYFGKPGPEEQLYGSSTYVTGSTYLGLIEGVDGEGRPVLTQKNKFSVGDVIEIMKPDGRNIPARVLSITNASGEEMESAPHPKEELHLRLESEAGALPWDILRTPAGEKAL